MIIRNASMTDAGLLARIIRESFADVAVRFQLTVENAPKHPSNCTEQWITAAMEKSVQYYILENIGVDCGCVALEQAGKNICYLERLAVVPECRRKGLGTALMEHAVREAVGFNARRIEIGIIANQTDLKHWYEKRGFHLRNTQCFSHLPFEVAFMFMDIE